MGPTVATEPQANAFHLDFRPTRRSGLPGVQVAQQADLRPVMDHFAIDVQRELCHRSLFVP